MTVARLIECLQVFDAGSTVYLNDVPLKCIAAERGKVVFVDLRHGTVSSPGLVWCDICKEIKQHVEGGPHMHFERKL